MALRLLMVVSVAIMAVALTFSRAEEGSPREPSVPELASRPTLRVDHDVTSEERPTAGSGHGADSPADGDEGEPGGREPRGVEVRVVDVIGAPIADAEVHPFASTPRRTDAEGRAWIPRFGFDMGSPSQDRRTKSVLVRAPGYAPVVHYGTISPHPYELVRLRELGGSIAGRCVDSEGVPLAGVIVRLETERGVGIELPADEDGRFSCDEAPWRRSTLRGHSKSHVAGPIEVVPPQRDVELMFLRWARVRGTLELGEELSWMPTSVRLRPQGRLDTEIAIAQEGPFERVVAPGALEVHWDGRLLFTREVDEGAEVDLGAVVLRRDADAERIETVNEDTEQPGRSYVVLEFSDSCPSYLFIEGVFADGGCHPLGFAEPEKGTVQMPLPSDDLRSVIVRSVFEGPSWREPASAVSTVHVHLPEVGEVMLRLRDRKGAAVEDGLVTLRWADVHSRAASARRVHRPWSSREEDVRAATLGPGEFRIRNVASGTYDLVWLPQKEGDVVLLRRGIVMTDPPGRSDLDSVSIPEPTTLRLRVVEGSVPVPFAVVRVASAEGETFVRADREGMAQVPVADPTALVIEAEEPRGGRGSIRVADSAIPAERLDVPLAR
jgi:hypothetical protein